MFTYLKPKTEQEIEEAFKHVDSARLFTGWLHDSLRRDMHYTELKRRKSRFLITIDILIKERRLLYADSMIVGINRVSWDKSFYICEKFKGNVSQSDLVKYCL